LSESRLDAWNTSARQYDTYEKKWHFYGTVADAMLRQLPLRDDSRVLELACGTGVCTMKIAKLVRAGKVVALDFSEGMLEVAKENAAAAGAANVAFVRGDAGEISSLFAGQKFDFAVCNSAFFHFPEPERVLAGLRELLTDSGEFALTLPSWKDGNTESREALRSKLREVLVKRGVTQEEIEKAAAERPRMSLDILALLRRCGFQVREVALEFDVSQDSRDEWRNISVFSGNRHRYWQWPGLDPEAQAAIRDEITEWRLANLPRGGGLSRWRIYVAQRFRAGSSK